MSDRAARAAGKVDFANRASGFAKPIFRLPGAREFALLWLSSAVAAGLATVTGAFQTHDIALGPRALFWAMLMGWNATKWQIWIALTLRGRATSWTRSALVGGVVLNLSLPIEIMLCLRAIGISSTPTAGWVWLVWLYALAISLALLPLIWALNPRTRPGASEAAPPITASIPPNGLLARAGIPPDMVLAIEAEDHYCRVHGQSGSSALIHFRFSDALAEVAGIEGSQVHRGIWVAASALRGAFRERRRWRLLLADGRTVPISASRVAEARRRGWLRRIGNRAAIDHADRPTD